MLGESDIITRHRQALGEARSACQKIARTADPDKLAPRGPHYTSLKHALTALEGSCRQMAMFRDDARWLKLGIVYGKTLRAIQARFVGQRWLWFGHLTQLFELGQVRLDAMLANRTGARGPILPTRPASEWLVLPDHKPALRGPGSVN